MMIKGDSESKLSATAWVIKDGLFKVSNGWRISLSAADRPVWPVGDGWVDTCFGFDGAGAICE